MHGFLDKLANVPVEITYGFIAMCGGMAHYLNGYADGRPFRFGLFAASTFSAGFSGCMLAMGGTALSLPNPIIGIMAGTGGFFSEQAMRVLMNYVQTKFI